MALLEMIRGESAEWDVYVRHPITSLPIDLTDKDLRFMAKREFSDDDPVIDVSTPSEIYITDPPGGLAHIKVPWEQTMVLDNEKTRLVYEFEISAGSDKSKGDSGYLIVNPEVIVE